MQILLILNKFQWKCCVLILNSVYWDKSFVIVYSTEFNSINLTTPHTWRRIVRCLFRLILEAIRYIKIKMDSCSSSYEIVINIYSCIRNIFMFNIKSFNCSLARFNWRVSQILFSSPTSKSTIRSLVKSRFNSKILKTIKRIENSFFHESQVLEKIDYVMCYYKM